MCVTLTDLRETEEEGGRSDEEGGGGRDRDIAAGTKRTGRSRDGAAHSSPNPPTAKARHRREGGTGSLPIYLSVTNVL